MFQLLGDYVPRPPTGVTHMGSTGEYVPTRHDLAPPVVPFGSALTLPSAFPTPPLSLCSIYLPLLSR